MRAVNLLPREQAAQRRKKLPAGPILGGVLVVGAAGALVSGMYVLESGRVTDQRDRLAIVEAELARTPRPPEEDPKEAELVVEKNARATVLAQALAERLPFDRVLRELSRVLPEDVWLSNLTAKSPFAAAGAAAGTGTEAFVLTGYTYSQEGVARLLARLAVVPYLSDVRLQRSALTEGAKRPIVEFTILGQLRSTKGSA